MGTTVRPAKTATGLWDAFADVDAFVAEGQRQLEGHQASPHGVVGYLFRMTTPRDPHYVGYRYPAELVS